MAKSLIWRTVLSFITETAFFCLNISASFGCTDKSQCPRGQICEVESGYCQIDKNYTDSSSTVMVLVPVGTVLALCIAILIFVVCYRRYTEQKQRIRRENAIPQNNTPVQGRYHSSNTCDRNATSSSSVQVSSNSSPSHLNLGFELLNPPPYFSIFTMITQQGESVQRRVTENREIQEVEVVWEIERNDNAPPAYNTLSLGPPWPPAYSEIGSIASEYLQRES